MTAIDTETQQRSAPKGHGGSPSLGVNDYWWYRARSEFLRTVCEPHLGDATWVLDVGSADSPSVDWLGAGQRKISLDLDPRGLSADGICGNALALPFADGVFDVVAAFDVIEHLQPEATALEELARVLRPGGTLLLSVPAYQWAWSGHDVANGHHRRYTRKRLTRAVVDAGVEVSRVTHAFGAVFPVFATERLFRRARDLVRPDGRQSAPADIATVPEVRPLLDRGLSTLCRLDAHMLQRRNLPFGSSILLVGTKPAALAPRAVRTATALPRPRAW